MTDFVTVLIHRYCEDDVPEDQLEMYVYSGKDKLGQAKTTAVTLVGREKVLAKIAQLGNLSKIALRDSKIASPGEPDGAEKTAPNLVELDLQGNELADWASVAAISRQLKKLEALNLSRMKLKETGTAEPVFEGAFDKLRVLVVNEGATQWAYMQDLETRMPLLSELHLKNNSIKELQLLRPESAFAHLKVLTLEDNGISSWAQVDHLAHLSNLEYLNLNKNSIEYVVYDFAAPTFIALEKCSERDAENIKAAEARAKSHAARGGLRPWAALKSLSLNHNNILTWESVNELNRFPVLEELKIQSNTVIKDIGFSLSRQIIISRIAGLQHLNGSTIRARERVEAEKVYLRKCATERAAAVATATAAEADATAAASSSSSSSYPMDYLHPRFKDLVATHGEPNVKVAEIGPGKGFAEEKVTVSIQCIAPSHSFKPALERQLSPSLLLRDLKLIIGTGFAIRFNNIKCFLRPRGGGREGMMPELMDDDTRQLSYYGITNGSEIIADEIDQD